MSPFRTKTGWCRTVQRTIVAASALALTNGCAHDAKSRARAALDEPRPSATIVAPQAPASPLTATATAAPVVADSKPSDPFIHVVSRGSTQDAPQLVRIAGFAVRLPSGEVVVDVPHVERGATHVRAPSVEARLAQLSGPKVSPLWPGTAPDPRTLAGALQTGNAMEGTRTSSTIVVVEGSLAPRGAKDDAAGSPESARTYELTNARITSTVTPSAWAAAYAKYEAAAKKLPRAFESVDPTTAALALDGIAAPLERLVDPQDSRFFEAVRWNRRLLGAMRDLERLGSRADVAAWTAATLPERTLDGEFFGRPRPTSAEREAYRRLFLFGGISAHRAYGDSKNTGDKQTTCRLLGETIRLLSAYDERFPILREIEHHEATDAKECGIAL